jgi:hypothetical protein
MCKVALRIVWKVGFVEMIYFDIKPRCTYSGVSTIPSNTRWLHSSLGLFEDGVLLECDLELRLEGECGLAV